MTVIAARPIFAKLHCLCRAVAKHQNMTKQMCGSTALHYCAALQRTAWHHALALNHLTVETQTPRLLKRSLAPWCIFEADPKYTIQSTGHEITVVTAMVHCLHGESSMSADSTMGY